MSLDPADHSALRWQQNGQAVFAEPLLGALRRLDRMFLGWACRQGAEEYRVPPFIAARDLDRLDYFRSFPHLVTFPVVLDADPEKLRAFGASRPVGDDGAVRLGDCAPVRDVLTPAACYHFYVLLEGMALERPRDLTTLASCWRREERYLPLQRQWCFSMREIVRIGTMEEVQERLVSERERLTQFFASIDLPIAWETASDPFFDPSHSPKYLAQRLDPLKTEMVFGDGLAIGSINFHRSYFGEAFGITREDRAAFSGCVAFGLERWLYAFLSRFGADPRTWPLPADGAGP